MADNPQTCLMTEPLPPLFLERLKEIIPSKDYDACLTGFSANRPLSVRINTLKGNRQKVFSLLKEDKIGYQKMSWHEDALILADTTARDLSESEWIKNGILYIQSLSSMLPVLVLDPRPGENILDMCAAPGSKTTQIAAQMQNKGSVIAVDNVKSRFFRLKSVVSQWGCEIVSIKCTDARRLKPHGELFDRILLDAPCSSEGRFKADDKESLAYWSVRKIKEMAHKQKGLLLSASRLLKPGGVLVYSTCTFSPEENEGAVDWLLKKTDQTFKVIPADIGKDIKTYPAIRRWEGRAYNRQTAHCLRVLPCGAMEGFFIAKLVKDN